MGLRINTNLSSLAAQRALGLTQRQTEKAMKQLASGEKFADLTEGAGEFAVAEQIRGQVRSTQAARTNAENAMSFVQVAEGGLNEQNNILLRQREIAIQAASDTISDTERGFLNYEYNQLTSELDRIARTTKFGTQSLLMGNEKEMEFQVGPNKGEENIIRYNSNADTTKEALGVNDLSVSDKDDARDSLENIDSALVSIARTRAQFGAMQSRLESVTNNASSQIENLQEAHSRMADTDIAKAYSEVVKGQALMQYQMQALSFANQWPGQVVKLIG